MSDSRPVTRTLACGSNASPPVEKGNRGWRRFSAGSLAGGTIPIFESCSIIRRHSSELTRTSRRGSCISLSRPQLSPPRTRTHGDRDPYAQRATPKWRADTRTARRGSIEASSSSHTSLGRGLYSGHDPEGQKGAARSEAPVFGRELNCISTCLKVKLAEKVGVQLTIIGTLWRANVRKQTEQDSQCEFLRAENYQISLPSVDNGGGSKERPVFRSTRKRDSCELAGSYPVPSTVSLVML